MKVDNVKEAWAKAYEVADTGMYELDKESTERAGYKIFRSDANYYSRICDLGCRLEVVKADGTSINIWIETTKKVKKIPHRAIAHYSEERGNSQFQLQRLAADILNYGKKVAEVRHCSQQINPDGEHKTIETGSSCIEVINELTGSRYWVHFSGCRVSEIIEEYTKQ